MSSSGIPDNYWRMSLSQKRRALKEGYLKHLPECDGWWQLACCHFSRLEELFAAMSAWKLEDPSPFVLQDLRTTTHFLCISTCLEVMNEQMATGPSGDRGFRGLAPLWQTFDKLMTIIDTGGLDRDRLPNSALHTLYIAAACLRIVAHGADQHWRLEPEWDEVVEEIFPGVNFDGSASTQMVEAITQRLEFEIDRLERRGSG